MSKFNDQKNNDDGKIINDPDDYIGLRDCLLPAKDFTELELPKKTYYLEPIVSDSQIILLTGWRGVGKSWFAQSICDCITRGLAFGPWKAGEPANCLYLDGEMAAQDTQRRLLDINPKQEREQDLFVYSDAYMNQNGYPKANLLNKEWRDLMKNILLDYYIKVFAIDNIASLSGGIDENSKKDWDPINQWLIDLRFAGITPILLHHTNKDGNQRGTSAREDNIDLSIILKKPPNSGPENGADFIVSFSKTRVPYEYLKDMQDTRFTLGKDQNGQTMWTWGASKAEINKEIVRLLNSGKTYDEIHDDLKIAKGRITNVKKWAIKNGILTNECKLTEDGFNFVNGSTIADIIN